MLSVLEKKWKTLEILFLRLQRRQGAVSIISHQALGLPVAIDSITESQLNIRQMMAAIVDAGENTENVDINMPFAHAGTVRVLLTSDSSIKNLKTNFTAESAKQTNGERYSLIEIEKPKGDNLNISFDGTPGNQVRMEGSEINLFGSYTLISTSAEDFLNL